jgi:hypothetical protein
MKPQVVFQKHIAGKTWRIAKHKTCARLQVYTGPYWRNVTAADTAVILPFTPTWNDLAVAARDHCVSL